MCLLLQLDLASHVCVFDVADGVTCLCVWCFSWTWRRRSRSRSSSTTSTRRSASCTCSSTMPASRWRPKTPRCSSPRTTSNSPWEQTIWVRRILGGSLRFFALFAGFRLWRAKAATDAQVVNGFLRKRCGVRWVLVGATTTGIAKLADNMK